MSIIGSRRPVFFFTTTPMPCPYLPGRKERRLVAELGGSNINELHSILSGSGFRRSHNVAYSPVCEGCNACVPVRIRVADFKWSRSWRRILNRNAHLDGVWTPARASQEQFAVFKDYQHLRHGSGDMALMDYFDYRSMIEETSVDSAVLEYRDHDSRDLKAAMLVDILQDGLSAVYSYFDPSIEEDSPGSAMVLRLVQEAELRSLPYIYLGFWIAESRKMAYKSRFKPLEGFKDGSWVEL